MYPIYTLQFGHNINMAFITHGMINIGSHLDNINILSVVHFCIIFNYNYKPPFTIGNNSTIHNTFGYVAKTITCTYIAEVQQS